MTLRKLFFLQFAVLTGVFFLFQIANFGFDRLATNLWYSPVHFFAGMWLSLVFLWFVRARGIKDDIFLCLLFVFSVGLAWEAWEYLIGAIELPYIKLDTVSDLVLDVAGGVLGWGILQRR